MQDTIPVQFTLPSPKIREKTTEPTYTFDTQVSRRHHVKKTAMKHAEIKERTIDLKIQQDKTSLRSRKGDTGELNGTSLSYVLNMFRECFMESEVHDHHWR